MNLLTGLRRRLGDNCVGSSAALRLIALCLLKLPLLGLAGTGGVTPGTNVTLIASADGTPAPTFQWRKNGNLIPGATGAMYSINGIGLSDAGTYQVVATNVAGSAISPEEVITIDTDPVAVAPSFVLQPVAFQTSPVGGTASFSVSASGTPAPSYQWQKNNVAIPGATNSSLTLTALTVSDSATYVATATNSAGYVTSSAAVLAVTAVTGTPQNVAPIITSQPSAIQTVQAGGSASFSVAAVGLPAPTYQWKKNGIAIPGATNATLALLSVTTNDGASYVAVASNVAGSVTSSAAILTVSAIVTNPTPPPPAPPPTSAGTAPLITSQPASTQTVVAGASASFTAVAAGNPAPTFQWRKNGTNIVGATNNILSINSVTTADAGMYSVLATNAAGIVVSDNSTLVVHTRPAIIVQPIPQAVLAGSTARFAVSVSAVPGATLQWLKNGVAMPGATSGLLMLTSITNNDVAAYSVVATNTLGSATSNSATLIIAAPPVITMQPTSQTVSANTNVELSASASASPAPSFQWKKNGSNINGATQATLRLPNVSKADGGLYSVEIANVAGWTSSSLATLTVNTPASQPSSNDSGDAVTPPVGPATPIGDVSTAAGIVNLSVRATAGAGGNALIVGFVINGTATRPLLIRGIGPTLRDFGVSGVLLDPKLSLYSGAVVTAANDDWSTNENAAQIVGTSSRVGAFSLPERTSDAALMATLETGAYTVHLSGKDATSGVGLVEVYDAGAGTAAKLVNLSVRAFIGDGNESPNVGFVIAGTTPRRVMLRAVGPGLAAFAVTGAITDPKIELFKGNVQIDQNDNWGGSAALNTVFEQVGAFGLSNANSRDAVLLVSLDPGAYTVVVTGANGATGVGLVELYDIP